jgi:alkylation response protein AidB-like acyl-CoA dehydrogenase
MNANGLMDTPVADYLALASSFAEKIITPCAPDVDSSSEFPKTSIDALRGAGFLGLCIPKENGGQGQDVEQFASVTERLAKACSSTAMVFVMHTVAIRAIVASNRVGHKDELLRKIAIGEILATLAFSEKGSRSHFWAPVSRLVPFEDGYLFSAEKSWVTSAHHADLYVCNAQKPDAASPFESTLFLLRGNAEGVNVKDQFEGLGLRGNDSSPVEIESAAVRESELLTEHGLGANLTLQTVLPWFAIGTAAMANGLSAAATEAVGAHLSNSRFAYSDSSLRDIPALRARLAQMSIKTEQARSLLAVALKEYLTGSEHGTLRILQSRLASIEAAIEVTDLAMKAAGGTAFSKKNVLERLFRDARAGWVMAPTSDHLQDFIGRILTGLPLFS